MIKWKINKIERDRKRRENKKLNGICSRCTKPVESSKSLCTIHMQTGRSKIKDFRDQRKTAGLCIYCELPRTSKQLCSTHLEIRRSRYSAEARKSEIMAIKKQAFNVLGDTCACCGDRTFEFLTIDHISNNGNTHRFELGGRSRGRSYYKHIIETKPLDQLQLLCGSCHTAKSNYGQCPHALGH